MTYRHDRPLDDALKRAMAGLPVDVYDDRIKLWAFLAVSAAFVAIGVAMVRHGEQIKGGIGVVFFLAAAVAIAWRLISSSTPAIRFDAYGVAIRRSPTPLRLAWSDIRSAYLASIRKQTFVCLALRDPATSLASAPPARRALMRANIALVGAPYVLPTALTLDVRGILQIIDAYAPGLANEIVTG